MIIKDIYDFNFILLEWVKILLKIEKSEVFNYNVMCKMTIFK